MVVQSKIIFRSDTWVVTPQMMRTLGGLHNWVVWTIMGKLPKQRSDWGWEYPPIMEALREAVIEEFGVYIKQRQNTVVQFIYTRTIMEIFLESESHPGGIYGNYLFSVTTK